MKKMITILLAIIFLAAIGFAAQTKKTTKKGVKKMENTAVIRKRVNKFKIISRKCTINSSKFCEFSTKKVL